MPSQTRSSIHVLEDSAIAALRDSLMASMREEMDKLRVEMRNNAMETNGGAVVKMVIVTLTGEDGGKGWTEQTVRIGCGGGLVSEVASFDSCYNLENKDWWFGGGC
nr:hypothetical protein [Tanacetum cinerariifolium]